MAGTMTYDSTTHAHGRVIVTRSEFDHLVEELRALRSAHRENLAERLRHARAFGVMGDQDDQLAAFEDAAVDEDRITRLQRLLAAATVVEGAIADEGVAGLGTIVRVRDGAGRTTEYELVGVRTASASGRPQVTTASPMGRALFGARAGDTVRVLPPNGRERSLAVVDIAAAVAARDDHGSTSPRRIA